MRRFLALYILAVAMPAFANAEDTEPSLSGEWTLIACRSEKMVGTAM